MEERHLEGGIANAGAVVRIGDFVLRPSNEHSAAIHRFLLTLREVGFDGASLPIGIDADGRERLMFVEGDVPLPPYPRWAQTDAALESMAVLMTKFHDASRSFDPAGSEWSGEMADPVGGTMICHNDVCLENVVFREGTAVALLDFDFAAPGRAVYDIAQFARMCVPVDDDVNSERLGWLPAERPLRLRLVADACRLDEQSRLDLLIALSMTIDRGGEFVRKRVEAGDPGFVAMWRDMGGMERFDRRRQWWRDNVDTFARALR